MPVDIRAANFGRAHDYDPRATGDAVTAGASAWDRLDAIRRAAARHIMVLIEDAKNE